MADIAINSTKIRIFGNKNKVREIKQILNR